MSISFYAGYKEPDREAYHIIKGVEPLNVSSMNAQHIVEALGLVYDHDGMAPIDIPALRERCTRYLRRHLGKPDPVLPGEDSTGARGARFIQPDRSKGYLQAKIGLLVQLCYAGEGAGATLIYAA